MPLQHLQPQVYMSLRALAYNFYWSWQNTNNFWLCNVVIILY